MKIKFLSKFYLLPFLILFFDYDYFSIFAVIFILYLLISDPKVLIKREYLKIFYLMFIGLRIFSGLSLSYNNLWLQISQKNYSTKGRFIDIQEVFWQLNCNSELFGEYQVIGVDKILNCPWSVSYGPILEYLQYSNDPALYSVIFSILMTTVFSLFYFHVSNDLSDNNFYIFTLVMVSPPINFLIERMNLDILIFVSIFIIYKFIKNDLMKNLLIFFLSLVKIYPIFLIIGNIVYRVIVEKNKNFKSKIINLIFFNISICYLYYLLSNEDSKYLDILPFRSDRTFGILSESINLSAIFGFNIVLSYVFILSFVLLISLNLLNSYQYSSILESQYSHSLLFMFFILCLYANYDYRLSVVVLLFPLIIETKNSLFKISYIFVIFSSPGFLNSYNYSFDMVENNFFIYLDIPLYFFLASLFIEFIIFYRKKLSFFK